MMQIKKTRLFPPVIITVIIIMTAGCGRKNYEKDIIGRWIAVERQCDENGNCLISVNVTGSNEYKPDGELIVGGDMKGRYSIDKDTIEFELKSKETLLIGKTRIIYIKGKEMLSRTEMFRKADPEKKHVIAPFIIKYRKAD